MFAEAEECTPVELVAAHRRCRQIARQFSKTPEDVANDINRVYLDSYNG
jgi:DNA-binding CsgD family transcriptional regulator